MKKWKKILIILASATLVTIACVISWSYGFRQGIQAGGLTSSIAELMLANNHMADQMTNANCQGVKQGINDYLKTIEKYKDNKDALITETTYHGDIMLGHIRLALIEDYQGNKEGYARHLAIAKEACSHRKWTDCSEQKLIWFSKRLEERNPMTCLSKE
ncbi:MAG: hypothetical protein HZA17_05445 [Nitrospirae bacterium]|nr:hypothetical protein [Nitrospirota bacterium]